MYSKKSDPPRSISAGISILNNAIRLLMVERSDCSTYHSLRGLPNRTQSAEPIIMQLSVAPYPVQYGIARASGEDYWGLPHSAPNMFQNGAIMQKPSVAPQQSARLEELAACRAMVS